MIHLNWQKYDDQGKNGEANTHEDKTSLNGLYIFAAAAAQNAYKL
jgi:hypothetical protein